MKSFKFISFSDLHISSINPTSRKGNYEEDILQKLEQIKKIGRENKVDFFICAGDIFNLKSPIRNSHELVGKLINSFKSYPAPIYATEGNHDLRNDSYETFEEQPIYVLYASESLIQIRNIEKVINGIKINIRSIPFSEEIDLDSIEKAKKDFDISIMVLHLYTSPEGGLLYKSKIYSYEELSKTEDDIYILGHYHIDQGIKSISINNKNMIFVNIGAISRGSLSEDNINRIPKIALFQVNKIDQKVEISYKTIPLDVKPPEEVFDFTAYEKEKKEKKEINDFISKLKTDILDSDSDHIMTELKNLNIEKKVFDKVIDFIQNAELIEKDRK